MNIFETTIYVQPSLQGDALRQRLLTMQPESLGVQYSRAVYDSVEDLYSFYRRQLSLVKNSFAPAVTCRIIPGSDKEKVQVCFHMHKGILITWLFFFIFFAGLLIFEFANEIVWDFRSRFSLNTCWLLLIFAAMMIIPILFVNASLNSAKQSFRFNLESE